MEDQTGAVVPESKPLILDVSVAKKHCKNLRRLLRTDPTVNALIVKSVPRRAIELLINCVSGQNMATLPNPSTLDMDILEQTYAAALGLGCDYVCDVVLNTVHEKLKASSGLTDLPSWDLLDYLSRKRD